MVHKVFKALSDPTRRRVLEFLKDGPLSAGELADHFKFTKPTMSAHFSVLREAGLVASRKQGKQVLYHLNLSVLEEALSTFASLFRIQLVNSPSPSQHGSHNEGALET